MSFNIIVLTTNPTLHAGYIVSVHRMVVENRPVDPAWQHPGGGSPTSTYILHED